MSLITLSDYLVSGCFQDAIAQYLGGKKRDELFTPFLPWQTDPSSVKGAIASLEDRVAALEQKLSGLRRLVG